MESDVVLQDDWSFGLEFERGEQSHQKSDDTYVALCNSDIVSLNIENFNFLCNQRLFQ